MAKQSVSNVEILNLVDEEGTTYKCIVPPEDCSKIIGGDYELANTYLQREIERKNRMLAFEILKQEQAKFIALEKMNTTSEDNDLTVGDNLTQCTEENVGETYVDNIEYLGSSTLSTSTTNELWPYNAVIALIASMAIHYNDLSHPKKKKKSCYNKWRSLLRSYKATKDKKMATGQGATRFMFYDQMEEILGNKPSHSSGHTIESNEGTHSGVMSTYNVIQDEASAEESSSGVEEKMKKRKRKPTADTKEAAKQKRHEERMEREDRKLDIEERKLALIERFIEKI